MTIRLGEATVLGDQVQLAAPGGFGTFKGVRLTNYTMDVLIVRGISGTSLGEEYLLPLQQMVYHTDNVSAIPTLAGIPLAGLTTVPTVLVEWSDDPLNDFIGTYPTSIGLGIATPKIALSVLAVPDDVTTTVIPANPFRKLIILGNSSYTTVTPNPPPLWIEWASSDTGWGGNPQILAGAEKTVGSTAALYFRAAVPSVCGTVIQLDVQEEVYG